MKKLMYKMQKVVLFLSENVLQKLNSSVLLFKRKI